MNNTIIQEKVKEFEKKFCYWHYKDNTGAVCKPSTDGFKFVTAKDATDWLTEALTSLVKEVREEEIATEWLLGDDTGSSSKAICRFMLGIEGEYPAPFDVATEGDVFAC